MDLPHPYLVTDGATGTELAARGIDMSTPLWSARALLEAPQTLRRIHREYFEAGAQAITANTFRTHARSLSKAGLGEEAGTMTRLAVKIAREARDEMNANALVFGSVAPLEDCYQPELAPAKDVCEREHRRMIEHLLDAGVDLILMETMGTLREIIAAARAAEALAAGRWMLSMMTRSAGPPGVLISGEPLADALPALEGAAAVGVNCIAAPVAEDHVRLLRRLLPHEQRIMVYANTGRLDERGLWTDTDAVDPARYAEYAMRWRDAGASIIGGCCGTSPETIRAVAQALGNAQ